MWGFNHTQQVRCVGGSQSQGMWFCRRDKLWSGCAAEFTTAGSVWGGGCGGGSEKKEQRHRSKTGDEHKWWIWIFSRHGWLDGKLQPNTYLSKKLSHFQNIKPFKYFPDNKPTPVLGISSFTDTACPWFSTVINVLLLLPKNTPSKPSFKKAKERTKGKKWGKVRDLIISSHSWTVALSALKCVYALSSVIGLFVRGEHFPSVQTNQSVLQVWSWGVRGWGWGAEGILVYLNPAQINYNAD